MRITTSGSNITSHNSRNSAPPPTRLKNKGWTKHAAIRNRNFLYQVIPQELDGVGYAITLTVKTCDTPEQWSIWRANFIKSLRRMGCFRYHFVTEWQRRGVPHLHCAVWLQTGRPAEMRDRSAFIENWLRIASKGNPSQFAQDVKPMKDCGHWLKYLAKHGVRGVSNYQRHASNIPKAWKGETGRVWLKGGDWPVMPFYKVEGLTQCQKHQMRRLFCRYLASNPEHLAIKFKHRIGTRKHWQRFLKCNDLKVARFKSPTSFIPLNVTVKLILSVNPDVEFYDEDTGELIDISAYRPPSPWVNPNPHVPENTDINDFFLGPSE